MRPKPPGVDDDRPAGQTDARCRYCGTEDAEHTPDVKRARDLREQARTFQVVVACASCGAAFAAISRN